MNLPAPFVHMMRNLLGPEWSDLESALHQVPARAVRLHRVSMDPTLPHQSNSTLALAQCPRPTPTDLMTALGSPVPWAFDGYYIPPESDLGRHPYHEMGVYYLQEPSAMAAVTALDPQPGERVLDLCAAPGGKTTGIAARMRGDGMLVANEIHPARVVTLAQNLERLGVDALVTQESPDALAKLWIEQFDAILVDAPCSGEGMFRKDPDAAQEWNDTSPRTCAERQKGILESAIDMLKPGGRLVYSTCTLNPEENERVIEWAILRHNMVLESLPLWDGWSTGRSDWTLTNTDLQHARRLWPHIGRGEGHFVCRMKKPTDSAGRIDPPRPQRPTRVSDTTLAAPDKKEWTAFLSSITLQPPVAWFTPVTRGSAVFSSASEQLPLHGLRVLRPGVCLGSRDHKRWEPHHHLAMSLAPEQCCLDHDVDIATAAGTMAGETLPWSGPQGWIWIHVAGLPVGWGKAVAGRINNAYPKGLRKMGLLTQLMPS